MLWSDLVDCGLLPNVLFDASGGRGGITPLNVTDFLEDLNRIIDKGIIWINMESGVRTDDYFDLNKMEIILNACEKYVVKNRICKKIT